MENPVKSISLQVGGMKGRRNGGQTSSFLRGFSPFALSRPLYLLLMLLALTRVSAVSGTITIGGLFEPQDEQQQVAFRYAVEFINKHRDLLPHTSLSTQVEAVPPNDSFRGSKKACSLLQSGVAAIFGPQSGQTSAQVQSICDAFEMPHIENMWDSRLTSDAFYVNLYPHSSTLSQAYMDVLMTLGWRKFCIIYENNDGFVRVQELLKNGTWQITFRQLPHTGNYRPMLKAAKKAGVTHVVLDVARDKVAKVLKQAQQIGMMTPHNHYFVTSLDLHMLELEDFRHGGTTITGLRLVDPENPLMQRVIQDFGEMRDGRTGDSPTTPLETQAALMYDAVHLFATALHELQRSTDIEVTPLDCDGDSVWVHGVALVNYMKWAQIDGLTGPIKLDVEGFRRNVTLDIVELTEEGLSRVGRWDPDNGANYTRSHTEEQQRNVGSLQDRTLVVTSVLNEPYMMLRDTAEETTGNDRYEGFCVDLIQEISEILGFNYTIQLAVHNRYGNFDKKEGKWNGMIGELVDQKADLAIADLTISHQRKQVVDFTTPWMNVGISILYKKPAARSPNMFNFLAPFSLDVWLYIATAYLGISLLLFILARLNPYETAASVPYQEDGAKTQQNQHIVLNSMCFPMSSAVQPKAASTRILVGTWWVFTLIMVCSYTANLAGFLTMESVESPFESAEDLASQAKIKYGCLRNSSTWNFFRKSKVPVYKRMFNFMESQRPTVYTNTTAEGVKRVHQSPGHYAYIMESTSIEHITERNCDLTQVGGLLDSKGYGIALPLGSPYTNAISGAILNLQEEGKLQALRARWWKSRRGGGRCVVADDESKSSGCKSQELGLSNVGGVFVVLLAGVGLALVVAVGEFVWKSRKAARKSLNE